MRLSSVTPRRRQRPTGGRGDPAPPTWRDIAQAIGALLAIALTVALAAEIALRLAGQ